jgi:hypothetical protein
MDKVQKHFSFNTNTPSPESYKSSYYSVRRTVMNPSTLQNSEDKNIKKTILSAVLHGFKTWSLTL